MARPKKNQPKTESKISVSIDIQDPNEPGTLSYKLPEPIGTGQMSFLTDTTPDRKQAVYKWIQGLEAHEQPEIGQLSTGEYFERLRTLKNNAKDKVEITAGIKDLLIDAPPEFLHGFADALFLTQNGEAGKMLSEIIHFVADNREAIMHGIERAKDAAQMAIEAEKEAQELRPFIRDELKARGIDPDNPEESEYIQNTAFDDFVSEIIEKARQKKDFMEALPILESSGTPKYHTSPNGTLANALQGNDGNGELIGTGGQMLTVIPNKDPEKEVRVFVNASLETAEGITLTGKPYTEYDRTVHDSFVSICLDREKHKLPVIATPEMLYRAMTGKTEKEYVSPQQKAAVTRSMDKMTRNILVKLDASKEMQARGVTLNGKPVTSFKKEGFLLSADKIEIKAGGKVVTGYQMNRRPLLLEYAELTGQCITTNKRMLDVQTVDSKTKQLTGVSIPNSENRIAVKSYLLRRVEVMRHDEKRAADQLRRYNQKRAGKNGEQYPEKKLSEFRKQSRTIRLDSVFEDAGIEQRTQARMRDYIFQVLDYWQAIGEIKKYTKRKGTGRGAGKTVDAVVIDF